MQLTHLVNPSDQFITIFPELSYTVSIANKFPGSQLNDSSGDLINPCAANSIFYSDRGATPALQNQTGKMILLYFLNKDSYKKIPS
jgi:hypothetical protein